MKRYLFIIICLFINTQTAFAEVTQFVFTTEPQTIAVNATSTIITIQSQNSSGTLENITETTDLIFTSSSPSGQFLSTSGNVVSSVMSRGTANKNFLYQDPIAGTYTLKINATGRSSLKTFSTSQQITVGNTGSGAINTSAASSGGNTGESAFSMTLGQYSAHSSPAPLSQTAIPLIFEVSAGRDRLASLGSLILFKAIPIKMQNFSEQNIIYTWSFGDGTTAQGKETGHAYKFAGEYVVVLNATVPDLSAVSRVSVKVIAPNISLKQVLGGIEVANASKSEINLEGWTLAGENKSFIFPKDTLIPSDKKVIFADEVTGNLSLPIRLKNPSGPILGQVSGEQILNQASSIISSTSLSEVQSKITEIKKALAQMSPSYSPKTEAVSTVILSNEEKPKPSRQIEITKATSTLETNVVTVFEGPRQTPLVSSIFAWPIKGLTFIRHLFVED